MLTLALIYAESMTSVTKDESTEKNAGLVQPVPPVLLNPFPALTAPFVPAT